MPPAMGSLLQPCGIASTFHRKLVWTALKYQGLGAKHPFYLMLQKQLEVSSWQSFFSSHNTVPTSGTSSCSAQKIADERPDVPVTLPIFRSLFLHPPRSRTVGSNPFFFDSPG
jgi:hypothetical protein